MNDLALELAVEPAAARVRRALAWVLALIAAALAIAWAAQWAAQREADSQAATVRGAIAVHTLGLRGVADRYAYLPFTVAQHPEVLALLAEPGDGAGVRHANRYLEEVNRQAGSEALYVLSMQGRTLAASNWNEPSSFVGERYTNRPYFMDASAGRNGFFYGIGKTTGISGLFIAAPVRRDGSVVGVVAVKVSLREIDAAWDHTRDPIVLSDARGIIFLSSVAAWMYHATKPLSAEDLDWVRRHEQYGDRKEFPPVPWSVDRTDTRDGPWVETEIEGRKRRFLAVDGPLPQLGWTLTVMADQAGVIRTRNLTAVLGTLAAGVLLLGTLAWQSRERRLAEQRHARIGLEQRVRERTRELHEAHAFRKAMEDSLLVGMRARDLAGRIVYVNPALCEMLGYRADELIGRLPPYPYWHPDDLDKHWRENNAALSGQAALTGFESRIRHRDGHDVHTMVYTAPLIDATGKHSGWMSSVVDITAQKRAEDQQRQQEAQLQHALRLASLGEMASTLAHELNQPMMALSNFASAAQAFAEQGEHALLVASLGEITAQAQRSADIVRRVRGFVRQRTPGVEACAINAIVGNVLALLKPEIRSRQVRVVTHLQADLPTVPGDRVLLEQVLLNLLLNSLQALHDTPSERRLVEIETAQVDSVVCLRVADQGPGIAPEAAAQLFEPFFTTKAGGLGLGLNICRTIIESHRGRLAFENRPGGGAVFSIQLRCVP